MRFIGNCGSLPPSSPSVGGEEVPRRKEEVPRRQEEVPRKEEVRRKERVEEGEVKVHSGHSDAPRSLKGQTLS